MIFTAMIVLGLAKNLWLAIGLGRTRSVLCRMGRNESNCKGRAALGVAVIGSR
jgi:hypothetical protein